MLAGVDEYLLHVASTECRDDRRGLDEIGSSAHDVDQR
jgi:hypothetical protein